MPTRARAVRVCRGAMRVRVFEQGTPTGVGKVVLVPSTLAALLLLCGRKLGLRATQVFLRDGCEIEARADVTLWLLCVCALD